MKKHNNSTCAALLWNTNQSPPKTMESRWESEWTKVTVWKGRKMPQVLKGQHIAVVTQLQQQLTNYLWFYIFTRLAWSWNRDWINFLIHSCTQFFPKSSRAHFRVLEELQCGAGNRNPMEEQTQCSQLYLFLHQLKVNLINRDYLFVRQELNSVAILYQRDKDHGGL